MLKALRASSPKYNEAIRFILVDWDTYKNHDATTTLKIPRQSTIVLIKGGKEIGRLVASTSRSVIKSLLDEALRERITGGDGSWSSRQRRR